MDKNLWDAIVKLFEASKLFQIWALNRAIALQQIRAFTAEQRSALTPGKIDRLVSEAHPASREAVERAFEGFHTDVLKPDPDKQLLLWIDAYPRVLQKLRKEIEGFG